MQRYLSILRDDLLSLLLLALLLVTVSGALAISEWAEDLWVLSTIVIIAMVVGYLLSISSFSDLTMVLFSTLYGLFAVWVLVGTFLPEEMTLRQRAIELGLRAVMWFEQVLEGGTSRDNLIFVLILAFVFWFLGFNAAANVFRTGHLWMAVIPAGLALLINTFYYVGRAHMNLLVVTFMFLTFALAARTNSLFRERLWRRERVTFAPRIRFDLLRGGLIAGLVVLALAWSAPAASASQGLSSAWDRSVNPWHHVHETFTRLFGGVKGSPAVSADYYGGTYLTLGGPINLSNATVMYVFAPRGYQYYWRSKVFDTYSGGCWVASSQARIRSDFGVLNPEEDVAYRLRKHVQQRFEMAIPATRLLYAAPQPLSFASLPVAYDVNYTFPNKEFAVVSAVRAEEILRTGDRYTANSSISIADETSLRGAGTDYPTWVVEQFLDLPESITARTHALAAEIAAPYDNPYDVARAIESYLRASITYNEQVAAPTRGFEPVDYLLFKSHEGYCNYYASAMVVMLRSQGIPSRVAVGFVQGRFDPDIGAYRVLESDAHAWVEVYFPRYGWIEFEPTAAESPIVRPEISPASLGQAPAGQEEEVISDDTLEGEDRRDRLLDRAGGEYEERSLKATLADLHLPLVLRVVLVMLALLVVGAVGAWVWIEQRGMAGLSEVSRSYARVNVYAPLVGVQLAPSATPFERSQQLEEQVPEGKGYVSRIVNLYVEEQYARPSGSPLNITKANMQARHTWQRLRTIFLRVALIRQLARLVPFRLKR